MKKSVLITYAILAVLIILGGIYYFSQNSLKTSTSPAAEITTPSGSNVTVYYINISGYSFNPSIITISKNNIVVWTNQDPTTHTVTFDSKEVMGSQGLGKGETYQNMFKTAGTYTYHCSIHTSMKGTIIVQ